MFKHFTYFSETVDIIGKKYRNVIAMDCAVETKSRDEIYSAFRNNDVLIMMVEPYNVRTAVSLLRISKDVNPNIHTIVYGTAATLTSNYLSRNEEIDAIVANGEFAAAISDIIERIEDNKTLPKYIKIAPNIRKHEWGCSLDAPVPLEIYKYFGNKMFEFTVQVGCPYNCSFCSEKLLFPSGNGNVFLQRSTDEVVNILKRVKGEYDTVYFSATTFTFDREWVLEICDKMLSYDCVIPWRSDTRVNKLDEKLVIKMKKAGLKQLSLGVESFENNLLDSVNKSQTADEIIDTIKMCKKNNVDIKALLILGLPGQTADDVFHTQEMITELGIPYRWKEYSPIRELYIKDKNGESIEDELKKFERMEFQTNSIIGLTSEKYMELLFPKGYIR